MRHWSESKVRLIKQHPLFAGCTTREAAAIASRVDEVQVPAGWALTKEGRSGREFFAIVSGDVEVRHGQEVVATLRGGDFFGELALSDGGPRSATVVSTTPVTALVIEGRAFPAIVDEFGAVARALLSEVSRRLRRAEQALV